VSTLASCGRLPATVPDLANRPRQLVFLTPIDSQLNDFLNEIHQIACFEPSIVERIDEDLDLQAKKKKLLRLVDAQFLAGQTPDLPKLELQLRQLKLDDIQLEEGRPRTEAYVVYVFLMLRGFNGGCKDQQARLLLEESITLRLWLEHLGLELPPASTLSDNLNAVSNQTRSLIHQVQLRFILQGGLDDFQKCFIDSTRGGSQHRATHGLEHSGQIDRPGLSHWWQSAPSGSAGHESDWALGAAGRASAHEPADSFPQGQSAGRSQAEEVVFPVTAAGPQAAQTSAARSGIGSPQL
jgi:hypothetical protein